MGSVRGSKHAGKLDGKNKGKLDGKNEGKQAQAEA